MERLIDVVTGKYFSTSRTEPKSLCILEIIDNRQYFKRLEQIGIRLIAFFLKIFSFLRLPSQEMLDQRRNNGSSANPTKKSRESVNVHF